MKEAVDLNADVLWGAKEIARYLGCSEKLVRNMAMRGQIPTFRQGRRVCARRSTLLAFVEREESLSITGQN